MAAQAGIDAEDQIDEMRSKLPTRLQLAVATTEFATVHDLIRQLYVADQRISDAYAHKTASQPPKNTGSRPTTTTQAQTTTITTNTSPAMAPDILAKTECHYCHQKGHLIRDCPTRPKDRRTPTPAAAAELPTESENHRPSAKTS